MSFYTETLRRNCKHEKFETCSLTWDKSHRAHTCTLRTDRILNYSDLGLEKAWPRSAASVIIFKTSVTVFQDTDYFTIRTRLMQINNLYIYWRKTVKYSKRLGYSGKESLQKTFKRSQRVMEYDTGRETASFEVGKLYKNEKGAQISKRKTSQYWRRMALWSSLRWSPCAFVFT